MKPVVFKGVNIVYGENQPVYQPLPAQKCERGKIITCWELTSEEIAEISRTGKLWVSMLTFNMPLQPILPSADKETLEELETP